MNLSVREFMESDREALRDLYVLAHRQARIGALPGAIGPADFDRSIEGERVLVAVHAEVPIGFASIWEPDSFLHNLFVHPRFQGRGVGKALLAGCEKYFSGVPTLKCSKANTGARRFYESQGWSVRFEAEGPDGTYLLMQRVEVRADNRA